MNQTGVAYKYIISSPLLLRGPIPAKVSRRVSVMGHHSRSGYWCSYGTMSICSVPTSNSSVPSVSEMLVGSVVVEFPGSRSMWWLVV